MTLTPENRERWAGALFVAPALLLLAGVLGFPLIAAFLQSFNLLWVEKPNPSITAYLALAGDSTFLRALSRTMIFVSATVSLHILIGLGVAMLLNADTRFRALFRVAAILPWTIPDVVAGMIWRFMFDPLAGFVNSAISVFQPQFEPIDWLGSPLLAFLCFVLAESWRAYPFIMLVLLAALQAIPAQQYEAARIDGATRWQEFWHITLPHLRVAFVIAIVLDVIWECRLFGMAFSLTGGGPGDATQVLSLLIYRQNFEYYNTSYSAAMAIVLAMMMLLVSLPYLRITMKPKEGS